MQRPSKERGGSVPPASSLQQAHSRGALFIRAGQRTAPGMFTGGGGNPLPTAFKSFRQDEDGTVMTACEMEANTVSLHPRLSIAAEIIIKAASAWWPPSCRISITTQLCSSSGAGIRRESSGCFHYVQILQSRRRGRGSSEVCFLKSLIKDKFTKLNLWKFFFSYLILRHPCQWKKNWELCAAETKRALLKPSSSQDVRGAPDFWASPPRALLFIAFPWSFIFCEHRRHSDVHNQFSICMCTLLQPLEGENIQDFATQIWR